ncbi:putative reverse transcriptase/RNA-dependent DNA polymerase [Citrus sinensis]|uniref:Reverse transcriptase/RNA-dependent DNA polymerase n=1 Tax=Citrus sinensis TaxID=2711 RepID=A0ACB8JSQ7_CITSI|nr:putative reverse transcriptase/RNA-dependent DNA polymerase [Citrus sinensis]
MATLKIDMSKTYDQIECSFLKAIMLRMGFAEGWVELIMMFVSTHVNYNKSAISFSANMDEAAKGKQCWKLMTTPQSLVVRILKARYYPRSAFTDATLDGSLATTTVNCLMLPDQQRWDNDLVADVFNTRDAALILQVKVFPICPICSAANEFVLHCLMECLFSQSCWLLSSIGFVRSYSSFFEWIEQMFNRCSKEECKLAMMVCWRIWLNRNDKVWNGHSSRAQNLVNAAGRYLFQWQEARKRIFTIVELVQLGHGSVCWSKPPMGWLKCNMDAGVFNSQDSFSFGGVIRDSRGAFVATKCQCFPGLSSPREAEALAVHEALNWTKSLQISKIIIEINCLNVYSALISQSISPNGFGLIIEDCRALAQLIGEVSFSFIRRSANVAAHKVAMVGGSMSDLGEWRTVPPPWLYPMLAISFD